MHYQCSCTTLFAALCYLGLFNTWSSRPDNRRRGIEKGIPRRRADVPDRKRQPSGLNKNFGKLRKKYYKRSYLPVAIGKANGKLRPGPSLVKGVPPLDSTLHAPALQEAPAAILATAEAPAAKLVEVVPSLRFKLHAIALQEAPVALLATSEAPAATSEKD